MKSEETYSTIKQNLPRSPSLFDVAALQKSANKSVPIAETSFLAFRGIFCCAVEWGVGAPHCSLLIAQLATC